MKNQTANKQTANKKQNPRFKGRISGIAGWVWYRLLATDPQASLYGPSSGLWY